ncbi:MAG TPA: bilirubin oxidase, partial [Micromonospora sp.]
MVARRQLFAAGAAGGTAALLLPAGSTHAKEPPPPPTPIDATTIPKYVTPLRILSVMPTLHGRDKGPYDEYRIALRQFRQQILPAGYPGTTIWGYGSPEHPETFGGPTATIEARVGRPVRVTWVNQLVDRRGRYLPHILPVDPTLHWANPAGGAEARDHRP